MALLRETLGVFVAPALQKTGKGKRPRANTNQAHDKDCIIHAWTAQNVLASKVRVQKALRWLQARLLEADFGNGYQGHPTSDVFIVACMSLSDMRTIERCKELFGASPNRSLYLVAKPADKMHARHRIACRTG